MHLFFITTVRPGHDPRQDDRSGHPNGGPFAETKELVAGYTLINVKSRQEALELSKRFPNPSGRGVDCEIEVRQMFDLEDFEQNDAIERFRKLYQEERKP